MGNLGNSETTFIKRDFRRFPNCNGIYFFKNSRSREEFKIKNKNVELYEVSTGAIMIGFLTLSFSTLGLLGYCCIGAGIIGFFWDNSMFDKLPTSVEYTPVKLENNTFLLGKKSHFKDLYLRLDKNNSALLIAGKKGSGKSSLLRTILTNSFLNHDNLIYYLCDYKVVELALYKKRKEVKSYEYTQEGIEETLIKINEIINKRNEIFEKEEVLDIETYNLKHNGKMKYIMLVIEEMALMKSKKAKGELMSVMAIGRSAGILIICTTQRPDSRTFDSFVKANFDYIIGLATLNKINSEVIGIQGLEDIVEKGRAKVMNETIIDFQSYWLSEKEGRRCLYDIKRI